MKNFTRRYLSMTASAVLCSMLCTDVCLPCTAIYDGGELAEVIVKLKEDAVLEAPEAGARGIDYLDTDAAKSAEKAVRLAQDKAEARIRRLYPALEIERRFILTANGFSCRLPESIIGIVSSDPLIESVSEVKAYQVSLPQSDASDSSAANPFSLPADFTGEGEVIAVIDTEFDVTHDMFAPMTGKDARLTKDDIASVSFSSDVDADRAYLSNKVPFAYDYSDDTPYTLDAAEHCHGTHVSGIAAGNRITAPDGSEISGIAPDAQILMMKVYGDRSGTFTMTDTAVAAAVEDAVRLGADVINMSFGRLNENIGSLIYADSIDAAENAGIILCGSAGNSSNDRSGSEKKARTANVDTGSISEPAIFPQVFAAASADTSGGMSRFSSYGVGTSLDMKPEITGIGGNVLSAGYNNSIGTMSGTSMASAYIAGCAALCGQMLRESGVQLTGADRPHMIKNILMNSAAAFSDEGLLLSPRRQGAGLVSLENAVSDKVIMTGASGKAAVELRDGIDNSFSFELNITNISSEDVTFTDTDIALTTDGYKKNKRTGKNFIEGQTKLDSENDLGGDIIVRAGSGITKTVTVTLDPKQLSQLSSVFTNGFFTEGFVTLKGAENCCDISIPIIGFRGDWCSVPTIDRESYPMMPKVTVGDMEMRTDISLAKTAEMLSEIVMNDTYLLSLSPEKPEDYPETADLILSDEQKEKLDAMYGGASYFSPNGDGFGDLFGCYYVPLREGVFTDIDLYDSTGRLLFDTDTQEISSFSPKLALLPDKAYSLPNGRYYGRIDSHIRYGDEKNQSCPAEIVIDRTAPKVEYDITEKDGRTVLNLTASDSSLDGIYVMGIRNGKETPESTANFNALAIAQRILSSDGYLDSAFAGSDERLSDSYFSEKLPDELTDMQAVLTGSIKPNENYNFCEIIPAVPDENGSFSISYDITGLGEYSICVLDRALNEFDIRPQKPLPTDFKAGIWKARYSDGSDEYYEFRGNGSVNLISTYDRSVYHASYIIEGERLTISGSMAYEPIGSDITWIDENNAKLRFDNAGEFSLTFVQEGILENFTFFSDAELLEMARGHYAAINGTFPQYSKFLYMNEDGTLPVEVYNVTDEGIEVLDVYTVERETALGTNRDGEPVDLKISGHFGTEGVWDAYTPHCDNGVVRYFKFTEFGDKSAKGVYAEQSDGKEHRFDCVIDGNEITFSFDSYEETGKPSRTAIMKAVGADKVELAWDNGFTEVFTCNKDAENISDIGFMTNDELIGLARDFFVKTKGETPEKISVRGAGEENNADIMIFGTAEDGSDLCIEEYVVNVVTGSGRTGGGKSIDIVNGCFTAYLAGDANSDGKVSVADAVAVLQYIGNRDKYDLSDEGRSNADVDGISGITGKDALVIQKVDAGIYTAEELPLRDKI